MIIVMINFARSGGTLLTKCIGSLPETIILSEINPIGPDYDDDDVISPRSVKGQAKYWYHIGLDADNFLDSILEIAQKTAQSGRHLILRDWTVVNFNPNHYNNFSPPKHFLTLDLLKNQIDIIPFAFVRDSIDVWISRGRPPIDVFFEMYLDYVNALIAEGLNIYKYEDFCQNPDKVLIEICEYCNLQYSESYKDYESFRKVTGDIQIPGGSRGIRQGRIKPLSRKRIPKKEQIQLNKCKNMEQANKILGYPTFYGAVPIESRWEFIFDKPTRIMQAISENPFYPIQYIANKYSK